MATENSAPAGAAAGAETATATATATTTTKPTNTNTDKIITPLPVFKPELYQRAWQSVPHPTLPLLATVHAKSVTVFSLSTLTKHSVLTGGHTRSVRSAAWQPSQPQGRLRLATGSFDTTAGLWTWENKKEGGGGNELEKEVRIPTGSGGDDEGEEEEQDDWELTLVLEGHENEVKSVDFSASGQYLATCSRDKSVWIWEDVGVVGGGEDEEDEWETVAVLSEHDGDVKAVAWCPDVPGRRSGSKNRQSDEVLASASYDNTVRIWREDYDGEWVCVAVLEGHEATVWGVQWESRPRRGNKFPRLITFSADATIRVWTLTQEEEDEEAAGGSGDAPYFRSGIPSTMRQSLREEWKCTAVLPKVHTRDIYAVSWSAKTGRVASTGSDGVIALYEEVDEASTTITETTEEPSDKNWRVLDMIQDGHGPHEINHITWCRRFDPGAGERKGEEEMLVTTGDDGVVRPWQVRV